jgi:hypothetical protein
MLEIMLESGSRPTHERVLMTFLSHHTRLGVASATEQTQMQLKQRVTLDGLMGGLESSLK